MRKERFIYLFIILLATVILFVACSNTGSSVTGTAPASIADLAVSSTTTDSAELTWTAPTDFGTSDGTAAASFDTLEVKVYEGSDTSGTEVTNPALAPASLDASSTTVTVSGLTADTQYTFELVLTNSESLSTSSTVTETTASVPVATAPASISDLSTSNTTGFSTVLTWSTPANFGTTDGTTAATFGNYGVKVYEGSDTSGTEVPNPALAPTSLDASSTTVTVNGLEPLTEYTFQLIVTNSESLSTNSNTVTLTTPVGTAGASATAPAMISDLGTFDISRGSEVVLQWTAPTDFGTLDGTTPAKFYQYEIKFYEGNDTTGPEAQITVSDNVTRNPLTATSTQAFISGLKTSTFYTVQLILTNSVNLSTESNILRFTSTSGL